MFKCHNCNTDLQDNVRFCQHCGALQPQSPAPPRSEPAGSSTPASAQPPYAAGGQPAYTPPSAYYNSPPATSQSGYPPKQKKMNLGCLIGCIIAGMVVLFLAVALVIGLMIDKGPETDNPPYQSQSANSQSGVQSSGSSIEALPAEVASIVGSWERYAVDYYGNTGYTPSQLDFLEDGTVNWYQAPGSENVVTGTYTVY